MGILTLNVGSHDSSICLFDEKSGPIIYLSERLVKKKHAGYFPHNALVQALKENPAFMAGLTPKDILVTSYGGHPKKLEEKYFGEVNPGVEVILEHMGLEATMFKHNPTLATMTHHRSHAYSVLAQAPFERGLILVVDGVGSRTGCFQPNHPEASFVPKIDPTDVFFETASAYLWDGKVLTAVEKEFTQQYDAPFENIKIANSIGILYQCASHVIFGDWMQAGKVMGMAAYGKPTRRITDSEAYIREFFAQEWKARKGKKEFDQQPEADFKRAVELAANVQQHFEERMSAIVKRLKERFPQEENIMLAGGCALNCLFNSQLMKSGMFKHVFVPPFPNDEGVAYGAAWGEAYERGLVSYRRKDWNELTAALGSSKNDTSLCERNVPQVFVGYKISEPANLAAAVADILIKGEVVAWVQGRSEVGPRALGHRSLLVRPDRKNVKEFLNENVKFREHFRPYGASVLWEKVHEYVDVPAGTHMPFMTFAPQVVAEARERLAGVTHLDGTCRIQTVSLGQNAKYHALLTAFYEKTGLAVLLNTSLNIMGQPILEDIQDAKKFMDTSPAVKFMAYGKWLIEKA